MLLLKMACWHVDGMLATVARAHLPELSVGAAWAAAASLTSKHLNTTGSTTAVSPVHNGTQTAALL
jgi:hypothetical protein